jgi:hypothetical protein
MKTTGLTTAGLTTAGLALTTGEQNMAVASNFGFAGRALFGVSLGLFALTGISAKAADQITFVSQGGAYQKAR